MPRHSLFYLERFRNEGTRTYSNHASYTEASSRYRPDSDFGGFQLPVFCVPNDLLNIYEANPPSEIRGIYLRDGQSAFCVHPQVAEVCPEDPFFQSIQKGSISQESLAAIPSSSTRTLYITSTAADHAVKVHFPFRVSRYTRKMRDEVVEQAINVSLELERGIEQMDSDFAFLREVIGVVHKPLDTTGERGENWGYLVRDMAPFPVISGDADLMPGFALYGKDFYSPDSGLLLFDLIGNQNPVSYLLDNIMLPIVRHWVGCFLNFGYLIEPHGQNVLLEIAGNGTVNRIVHRDLSVGIDMRRRRDIELADGNLNQYNRMENSAFHSITYDRFMGTHFFDRLVETCRSAYPTVQKTDFSGPCREEFARLLPEHGLYFPETIWYFSEKRDRFNKPLYQDTGVKPEWRP